MNLLWLFVLANIINVILSTIKTLVTIKANKYVASLISAINYAFNVYIVVLTVCELPLWEKCLIVGLCNLFGVFIVKWVEEETRKDKLWRLDLTVPTQYLSTIDSDLHSIPHSYIQLNNKHTLFSFYCATKEETKTVKNIANHYQAKYFVIEGKEI